MAQGAEAGNLCLTAFLERRSIDALSRGFLVELVSAVLSRPSVAFSSSFAFWANSASRRKNFVPAAEVQSKMR